MKVIDAHMHTNFTDEDSKIAKEKSKVDITLEGVLKEMKDNNVERAIGISVRVKYNKEFSGILERSGRKIWPVAALSIDNVKKQVKTLERDLRDRKFIGLKLYPGYEHFCPGERRLEPFYQLAEKHNVPVIFHSGSFFMTPEFKHSMLKFAHPLHVDEVATMHPDMKIVIAHCGNPWFLDVAAVMDKNANVH